MNSWYRTAETIRRFKMIEDKEDGLGTTLRLHYCMHKVRIIVCITCCILNDVVVSDALSVSLFQENKSYGSKNHLHSSSDVQENRVGHRSDLSTGQVIIQF